MPVNDGASDSLPKPHLATIILFVEEHKEENKAGRFIARLADGSQAIASSRQPFLAAARALLARGVDPNAILVMTRSSTGTEALRARVGDAAKLSVDDNSSPPRFVPFRPPPSQRK